MKCRVYCVLSRYVTRVFVGDMGAAVLGARLAPELAVKGVEICARRDKESSTRLPLWLSVGAADVRVMRIFSLPFCDESVLGSESLAAVPRRLPRSLLLFVSLG